MLGIQAPLWRGLLPSTFICHIGFLSYHCQYIHLHLTSSLHITFCIIYTGHTTSHLVIDYIIFYHAHYHTDLWAQRCPEGRGMFMVLEHSPINTNLSMSIKSIHCQHLLLMSSWPLVNAYPPPLCFTLQQRRKTTRHREWNLLSTTMIGRKRMLQPYPSTHLTPQFPLKTIQIYHLI